jgi:hypothetical protein
MPSTIPSTMPTLTADDCEPASDKKPPAKRQFYAIRKCDSLKAPAIFLHWDDCCFYVDNEENDGRVDYQTFDVITDAFKYITIQQHEHEREVLVVVVDPKASAKKSQGGVVEAKAKKSPAPAKRAAVKESLDQKSGLLVTAKNRKTPAVATTTTKKKPPATSAKKGTAVAAKIDRTSTAKKSFGAINTRTRAHTTPAKAAPTSTKKSVNSAMAMAMATTSVKSPPPMTKREVNWEAKFLLLKQFKKEFGACHCQALTTYSSGKYKGLDTWVRTAVVFFSSPCLASYSFSHLVFMYVFVFGEGKIPA